MTKEQLDQRFFIELAQQGKNEWNAWREANPGIPANFEGVDFTLAENEVESFLGFHFGDEANFDHTTFGNDIYFSGATFGDNIGFNRTTLGNNVYFSEAAFGSNVGFTETKFGSNIYFKKTKFGNFIHFSEATFGDNIHFSEATFGDNIFFDEVTFDAAPLVPDRLQAIIDHGHDSFLRDGPNADSNESEENVKSDAVELTDEPASSEEGVSGSAFLNTANESPARKRVLHKALYHNKSAVLFTASLLEEVDKHREHIRKNNDLTANHPEQLEFIDELKEQLEELITIIPLGEKAVPLDEVEAVGRWAGIFLEWKKRHEEHSSDEAISKILYPAAITLGLAGVGALVGLSGGWLLGFGAGAGAVAGGSAGAYAARVGLGYSKPDAISKQIESALADDDDKKE